MSFPSLSDSIQLKKRNSESSERHCLKVDSIPEDNIQDYPPASIWLCVYMYRNKQQSIASSFVEHWVLWFMFVSHFFMQFKWLDYKISLTMGGYIIWQISCLLNPHLYSHTYVWELIDAAKMTCNPFFFRLQYKTRPVFQGHKHLQRYMITTFSVCISSMHILRQSLWNNI